jgi:rod shape determining protein RodA
VEWKRLLGGCPEVARTIDLPLLIALLILMGAGLAVLHSVSGPVAGQAARFAGGLASMWLLSRVSLLRLRAWTPAIYALSMLPLMAVYVIGTGKYGQRWLNLGVFYLQPSELLKLSLPLMMAWYLHRQPLPPSPRTVLTTTVLIGVPAVLILMQPNLGTATLVTASGVFALLLAGLHWGWVATGAAATPSKPPVSAIAASSGSWGARPSITSALLGSISSALA